MYLRRRIQRLERFQPVRNFKMTIEDLAKSKPNALRSANVFVRVDFNVPLNKKTGQITDDTRIIAALPTINFLRERGAKVILASHCGRPEGKVQHNMRMLPMAKRLSELINQKVVYVDECIGPKVEMGMRNLREGGVLMLENVRFHAEEELNEEGFSKALAKNMDIYVNDAFGTAHRAHASTAGVTPFIPIRVAGFLMEKEIRFLKSAVDNPARPFAAIVGGAKVSTKIPVLESLIDKCDVVYISGALRFTFYKAMGYPVGSSMVEPEFVPSALALINRAKEKGCKLILPEDSILADSFDAEANSQVCDADKTPAGWMGLDIGPKSIETLKKELSACKTIVWNGPMGVFEFEKFSRGTFDLCKIMADVTQQGAITIIGGGDVVAAVHEAHQDDKMTHISTGGGASLEMLEGKDLPGVAVLNDFVAFKKKMTLEELVRVRPQGIRGANVFVRVDFNCPRNKKTGKLLDDAKIVAALPTINFLRHHGAKVILASHSGRPEGDVQHNMRMIPMAKLLSALINEKVVYADECVGDKVQEQIQNLKDGEVLMLENLRFHSGEEQNNLDFSKALAKNIDIYVNDAFGTAHRAHASTVGVTSFIPVKVAGCLMEKELNYLKSAIDEPARPFAAIIGGSRLSSKVIALESLVEKADILYISGALRFTFYAALGWPTGNSTFEPELVSKAAHIMERARALGCHLVLPEDSILADNFDADAESQVCDADKTPAGWMGLDIGPKSIETLKKELSACKTIVWNGPMGVFEFEKFSNGTYSLSKIMADLTEKGTITIIAGGDVCRAVREVGDEYSMTHVSTGGNASIQVLEGRPLPGINVLDISKENN